MVSLESLQKIPTLKKLRECIASDLPFCLSVCLSLYLSVCLFVSVRPYGSLSVRPSGPSYIPFKQGKQTKINK